MMKKLLFMGVFAGIVLSAGLPVRAEGEDSRLVEARRVIEQQKRMIQALQEDNQRLLAQIEDLNRTIDGIRSQAGGGQVRPT